MIIHAVSHGAIDASDQKLLEEGNPHLDPEWIYAELQKIAERLDQFGFTTVHTGTRRCMVEMFRWVNTIIGLPKSAPTTVLDSRTIYYEGTRYPVGVEEPMMSHMRYLHRFYEYLFKARRKDEKNVVALWITAPEIMAVLRALAREFRPTNSREMLIWAAEHAKAAPGETWIFQYDGKTLKEVDWTSDPHT